MTDSGHRYSCLMPVKGFLSHKAFLIGHDRSFWLPDLIYTSLRNICCSASLHRVLSYELLKVVVVSTRGSRGSVTTDKGRKTNKCNTRKCVNMFDLKGTEGDCSSSSYQYMIGKIGTALPPFLFSLHVLPHLMLPLCSEIQLLMCLVFNNSKKSNIRKKLRRFGSISSIRISTQTI